MQIKLNPSGVHIKKGLLKIRADIYLDDPALKTYAQQYVRVPIIGSNKYTGVMDGEGSPVDPAAYQAWLNSLPHVWQLNPALCHFFTAPENFKLDDLTEYLKERVFTPDSIATLDNCLVLPGSAHYVSPFMKQIPRLTDTQVTSQDLVDLVASAKTLLTGKVIDLTGGGKVISVEPQSIDIGGQAVNRSSALSRTFATQENPANATGTLDTCEIWANTDCTVSEFATFYVVSGNNLSTRDNESTGAVTSGSKQTFTSLSIDVTAGDYLGVFTDGNLEVDGVAGGHYDTWYKTGDNIPCTNTAFSVYTTRDISIYATGTESGGVFCPYYYRFANGGF